MSDELVTRQTISAHRPAKDVEVITLSPEAMQQLRDGKTITIEVSPVREIQVRQWPTMAHMLEQVRERMGLKTGPSGGKCEQEGCSVTAVWDCSWGPTFHKQRALLCIEHARLQQKQYADGCNPEYYQWSFSTIIPKPPAQDSPSTSSHNQDAGNRSS